MGSVSVEPPAPFGFTEDVNPENIPPPPDGFTEDVTPSTPEFKPTIQEPAPSPAPSTPTPSISPEHSSPGYGQVLQGLGSGITKSYSELRDPITEIRDAVGSMFKPSDRLKQDIAAQAALPPSTETPAPDGFTEDLAVQTPGEASDLAFLWRGLARTQRDAQAGRAAVGELSPQEAAQNYVYYEQEARKYKYDPEVLDALQKYPTDGTDMEVLSWMWNNKKATATMIGDNIAGVAIGAALPIGAGMAASPGGPGASTLAFAGTAAITSAVLTGMNDFTSEMEDSGIDTGNMEQVQNFFASPEAMQKATKRAILHGVPVGVIDGITGLMGAKGFGGKVVDGLWKPAVKSAEGEAIKGTVKRAIAESGVNAAIDLTGAGVGEIAGEYLSTGKIQPSQYIPEIAFELPGSIVQGGYETYLASKHGNVSPADAELVAKAGAMGQNEPPAPPPAVDADTAAKEGRTFYGYAEPGKPVEVTTDYVEAERKMGSGPAKRGTLIAVKPEEVDGSIHDLTQELIDSKKQGKEPAAVIEQLVATVPEEQRSAAANALFKVIESKSPTERDAAFSEAQALGVRVGAKAFDSGKGPVTQGSYRGPIEGRQITPKMTYPISLGSAVAITDANGEVSIQPMRGTKEGVDIDGKKLGALLKGKLYFDPQSLRTAKKSWGKAVEKLVGFKNADLRRRVFETNEAIPLVEWQAAVRSGDVTFTPDNRLTNARYRILDATKEEVQAAIDASKISLPRGADKMSSVHFAQDWVPFESEYSGSSEATMKEDETFFSTRPEGVSTYVPVPLDPSLEEGAKQIETMLQRFMKTFGLTDKLVFVPYEQDSGAATTAATASLRKLVGGEHLGMMHSSRGGINYISVRMRNKWKAANYVVAAHEFGHFLAAKRFSQASPEVRAKVYAAYRRWLEAVPSGAMVSATPISRRFASTFMQSERLGEQGSIDWFYKSQPDYMLSFDEWFAEQVARWASANAKPLGMVSKFFKKLAREIIEIVRTVRKDYPGEDFAAEPEIAEWIDSQRFGATGSNWGASVELEHAATSATKNRPYLGGDTVPLQAESTMTGAVLHNAVSKSAQVNPSTVASINAHNDRFNWFYKVALTLRQVALRNANNPLLAPLYRYLEYVDLAKQESNKIMGDADQILLKARNLKGKVQGKSMADQLAGFIDDLSNMTYLSPQEQANGVRRHPTQAEFAALVKQYGLSNEAVQLYLEVKGFFDQTVDRFHQLDLIEAGKLSDLKAKAKALQEALTRKRQMLASPYFPKSRFGKWAVTVRDANGKVESFELFDTKRGMSARQRELESQLKGSGSTVATSELPQEVESFVGIPAWMLDKLNALPGMSKVQQQWIEQLRYHLAPQRSFAKHFLKRKNTAGYSLDWRRSFANYGFHHARNFARLKYGELARTESELLKGAEEQRPDPFLSRVANMMADHYGEFINPSRDWAILRSVTALFHLGFSPATAMMNLSQVPLVTMPFLADKFGDGHAMGALTRAAGNLSTYYKKGNLAQQTGPLFKAINEAMRQGIIDESQAWQLASFSGGSKSKTLQRGREAWLWTTSKGMFLFSMAEQWNRRVTFRAAYELAFNNPSAKWMKELDIRHSIELADLKLHGWTEREAKAFLAAKETVQQTQFQYDKSERPKFMRGKKANLFAFYMFTQNMLFTMWNNPGAAGRYMLAMAILAGPMGLVPDDIEDILNAVARQLFGKDFNLERYARGLVVDMIGETAPGEEPKIAPDLILHGTSRYSYGIPWLMSQVGVDWLPNVDRSKSIALNRVLPMGGVTSLLRPSADVNQSIYQATQDVAGAAFGPGLAVYKALSQSDLSLFDLRNWQAAMPKAAKSVTEAVRNYYNAGQVDRKGGMQVPYDRNDPQQVAELIATALGYQPTRKSQFYDRQSAIYEVDQYWSGRRAQLLQDAFVDRFDSADPEAWNDARLAIVEYNKAATQVDKKYAITPETLKRSFQAKQTRRKELGQGIPPGVSAGVVRSVGALYPESNVIFEKKVR